MSELMKNLIKRFEYNRKHKKIYLIVLLIMAIVMLGTVTWELKLTGVSVTADDTEIAEALEADAALLEETEKDTQQETVPTQQVFSQQVLEEQEEPTETITSEKDEKKFFELNEKIDDDMAVSISGDCSSLPYPKENVQLKAEKITDESDISLCNRLMDESDVTAEKKYLLNLSLYHEDDAIVLTGKVTITFKGMDFYEEQPRIYSVDAEKQTVDNMEAQRNADGDVVVETDHLSMYVIGFVPTEKVTDLSKISGETCKLDCDIKTSDKITITKDTTLDLNGYSIQYDGTDSLFSVNKDAIFTIKDSQSKQEDVTVTSGSLYKNQAMLILDENNAPALEYYVTKTAINEDGISTSEKLEKHFIQLTGGYIIATAENYATALVTIDSGATFQLESGFLTIKNSAQSGTETHIVKNNGTMSLIGGYIAGGKAKNWGGGIYCGHNSVMNMSGGVIAANTGSNGGGLCLDENSTFKMTNGTISGNEIVGLPDAGANKRNCGFGGGIYAKNASCEIDGGYITNNLYDVTVNESSGNGCHGGGGIATEGGVLTIKGGFITGNYSKEAGGGVYAGHYGAGKNGKAEFHMNGGIVASNYAEKSEGGGIRISGFTEAEISANESDRVYITNNTTNTSFDWGGGGIFVQENGKLQILSTTITNNTAGGFGGGVGACPTGETVITHNDGAAIYNNSTLNGTVEEKEKHMSKGGYNKNYDSNLALKSDIFYNHGKGHYSDYFCIRGRENSTYISLITGTMLGGSSVTWNGSCDEKEITINKFGYAAAKYMFGLDATPEEEAVSKALEKTRVFISGNSSYTHGGGVMTNGALILGKKNDVTTDASLEISGSKNYTWENGEEIAGQKNFTFQLTDKEGTKEYGTVESNKDTGIFTISPNENYNREGIYTYYLKEVDNRDANIKFDQTRYKIDINVVGNSISVLDVKFTEYKISDITITRLNEDGSSEPMQRSKYKIHYQSKWEDTNLYIWQSGISGLEEPSGKWPGTEIKKEEQNSGWCTIEIPMKESGTFNCIFNNSKNTKEKTEDIENIKYAQEREVWISSNNDVSYEAPEGWKETSSEELKNQYTVLGDQSGNYFVKLPDSTFTNIKKYQYELPETGGTGTIPFTTGGLLFVVGGLWYRYSMKRRRERRAG